MALDISDLGSRVFNITMGSVTTPTELAAAIEAVVPGAKVKFDTPPAPPSRCRTATVAPI